MIAYRITLRELEALVDAHAPKWRTQAKAKTKKFKSAGAYTEAKGTWSAIKAVYMRLQGNGKCAFCERMMESEKHGLIEQDVEHFRPKKRVLPWPVTEELQRKGVVVAQGDKASPGYHLLAYHPFNYTAACKPCNSILKGDRFPIAGKRNCKGEDPAMLAATELPFLIYPIGDFDDDPEDLITFRGTIPKARKKRGHPYHRALVTIDFFQLADPDARTNLHRDRAFILVALLAQLEKARGNGPDAAKARERVAGYTASSLPHANCARSFVRLFESKPEEARRIADDAADFVAGRS